MCTICTIINILKYNFEMILFLKNTWDSTQKSVYHHNYRLFKFYISQNVANPCPILLVSHVVANSLLVVCLSRQDGAIYRPPKHSDRLKKH